MTLIFQGFLPRLLLDLDKWFTPKLDLFDPFDDLDNFSGKNIEWLTIPSFNDNKLSSDSRKYRITLNCSGYNPKSIKTEIKKGKLVVSGKEEEKKNENGDYSTKQFRKTFSLPENSEPDKLVTFMPRNGHFVVEVPLTRNPETGVSDDVYDDPEVKIVEDKAAEIRRVFINCSMPKNIDPSKMSVTYNNCDLIIKTEVAQENKDTRSKIFYYKKYRLPENTDFNSLKCRFDHDKLKIEAKLKPVVDNKRQIPIQYKKVNSKL